MNKLEHLVARRGGNGGGGHGGRKIASAGESATASAAAEAMAPTLTRRGFVIGATAGGFALAFASTVVPQAARAALQVRQFEPTVWFVIDREGIVTVKVAEAEMGQHIGTALARIVADELEVRWDDVRLDHVDSDGPYGYRVTGGSWSVWQNFDLLSRAGAAGRRTLVEEGAKLLGQPVSSCRAEDSRVIGARGAQISYAEIVRRGDLSRRFSDEELAAMPIKPARTRRLIGRETRAIDIPEKTRGEAVYGIDAVVPGMVYGRPILPPTRYGSRIRRVNDRRARNVEGYRQTLVLEDPSGTVPGWAMVIADSFHAADRAARLIRVSYAAGDTADVSEADIQSRGRELLDDAGRGSLVVEDPGVDAAFAGAERVVEAEYTTSTALHFQMEPLNALALQREDGVWELHTGNQWQSLCLPWYAKALGIAEDAAAESIVIRTYMLGGGFGRRLNGDYGVPALLAAKALGRPVKMVMKREEDSRFDSVRSASVQRVSAALRGGEVVAMQHHAAAGWPTEVMAPFFLGKGSNDEPFDPFSINGADHWYSVGAQRVRAVSNDLANRTFRPGWLRSVGPGWTNWASESLLDEVAHALGRDPLQLRLSMLRAEGRNAGSEPNAVGGAGRLARVLRRAAGRAGWGRQMPRDSGLGIAATFGQERAMPTWTACVADVSVDRASGRVTVNRLTLVLDAGTIVHPDGAIAQTEGAALWGLSLALHEGTRFVDGEVEARNLDRYTPLRMSDVPELDIELVDSPYQSVGLGEPATTVVGPAIGNAIFAAVGARLRDLPITAVAVKKALA